MTAFFILFYTIKLWQHSNLFQTSSIILMAPSPASVVLEERPLLLNVGGGHYDDGVLGEALEAESVSVLAPCLREVSHLRGMLIYGVQSPCGLLNGGVRQASAAAKCRVASRK
jgi:hypothetical protein